VAYDSRRPLQARIISDGSAWLPWIGPVITGFVGLAFLGAALFARWFFKPGPAQGQEEQG
jgi:hypothetical protein